ncbi:MAG: DUF3179 domain-containing protein [Cytophagales bacterium]|nr:DUF3179 domain-containing protein [Cytophagales bacterium]
MRKVISLFFFMGLLLYSCNSQNQNPQGTNSGGIGSSADWLIPEGQVFDGGPGKDGIPALDQPQTSAINEISYLSDDDLVVGFSWNGNYRAYPHKILDWHEIINDDLNGSKIAVTYCPLTGTGIGWNREIAGIETTFGVSGLLYNSNLIPYDRYTDSNWCQISLSCVNGTLKGSRVSTFTVIETTWGTWKMMFPNSTVVNTNTGFSRNYRLYPYGDYRTNHNALLFPVNRMDERIPAKERVLAVIENEKARVYQFKEFEGGTNIITDNVDGKDIVIIGNKEKNFIIAFENMLNGAQQNYTVASGSGNQIVFSDTGGNGYDLFGNVIEGPDKGSRLLKATSFMAYWFSIGAFYPNTTIYNFGN